MAGSAVTLAGFAAVFRAFGGDRDPDGHSRVRLNSVIEGGLLIAFTCYLPIWLGSLPIAAGLPWRIASLVIVIWAVARIVLPSMAVLRGGEPLPEMFVSVVAAGALALIAAIITTAGFWPYGAFPGYLFAVLMLLANVGLIFIAQFRVERSTDEEN